MKLHLVKRLLLLAAIATSTIAFAGDQEDAAKSAKDILSSLHNGKYERLWDSQMSELFKSKLTKNSFLANMAIGRPQLGTSGKSEFVDMAYSKNDPGTGFKGEIYSFNYLTEYSSGKVFERIVVVKEKDGQFRLAGLWGAPAPKEK